MQLLDRVSNKAHLPATIEITLVIKQDAETVKLDAGKMLIDYGIDGPRKVYLNPADFRVFCKLPSNKVIVVVVNSADVASQIRKKAEVVSQTKLANTVLVYGVEEMEDSFTVVDYGIAADATIRIATGGKGDGTGKKWADVDAGNYARTAGKIKVWRCSLRCAARVETIRLSVVQVEYGQRGLAQLAGKDESEPSLGRMKSVKEAGRALADKLKGTDGHAGSSRIPPCFQALSGATLAIPARAQRSPTATTSTKLPRRNWRRPGSKAKCTLWCAKFATSTTRKKATGRFRSSGLTLCKTQNARFSMALRSARIHVWALPRYQVP